MFSLRSRSACCSEFLEQRQSLRYVIHELGNPFPVLVIIYDLIIHDKSDPDPVELVACNDATVPTHIKQTEIKYPQINTAANYKIEGIGSV